MITIKHKGDLRKTQKYLKAISNVDMMAIIRLRGQKGVMALNQATPKQTGKTAQSWDYRAVRTETGVVLYFVNTNINDGVQVALVIQYGHAGANGCFIQGRDYINPALKPIFDDILRDVKREVTSL